MRSIHFRSQEQAITGYDSWSAELELSESSKEFLFHPFPSMPLTPKQLLAKEITDALTSDPPADFMNFGPVDIIKQAADLEGKSVVALLPDSSIALSHTRVTRSKQFVSSALQIICMPQLVKIRALEGCLVFYAGRSVGDSYSTDSKSRVAAIPCQFYEGQEEVPEYSSASFCDARRLVPEDVGICI